MFFYTMDWRGDDDSESLAGERRVERFFDLLFFDDFVDKEQNSEKLRIEARLGLLQFVVSKYDGSLPKLTSNPYSWTKVANILFIDSPVGAGFSYSETAEGNISGERQTCWQTYEFLKKWLIGHPEFLPNPIYVGGVSYGGFTVPLVVQHISDANKAGIEPFVNLKV
ncbi:hypothetical protein GIB67_018777 [Kingdonia uniflora]|uniref:Uncharacterized protein n=1 Tax=Kingdonia uniflora TaxID=39325 RepID=A0A7J7NE33_9MAGN|nr:hypothetical protein GIB67_018777 [Kingdonia uniflora]